MKCWIEFRASLDSLRPTALVVRESDSFTEILLIDGTWQKAEVATLLTDQMKIEVREMR